MSLFSTTHGLRGAFAQALAKTDGGTGPIDTATLAYRNFDRPTAQELRKADGGRNSSVDLDMLSMGVRTAVAKIDDRDMAAIRAWFVRRFGDQIATLPVGTDIDAFALRLFGMLSPEEKAAQIRATADAYPPSAADATNRSMTQPSSGIADGLAAVEARGRVEYKIDRGLDAALGAFAGGRQKADSSGWLTVYKSADFAPAARAARDAAARR